MLKYNNSKTIVLSKITIYTFRVKNSHVLTGMTIYLF